MNELIGFLDCIKKQNKSSKYFKGCAEYRSSTPALRRNNLSGNEAAILARRLSSVFHKSVGPAGVGRQTASNRLQQTVLRCHTTCQPVMNILIWTVVDYSWLKV